MQSFVGIHEMHAAAVRARLDLNFYRRPNIVLLRTGGRDLFLEPRWGAEAFLRGGRLSLPLPP